MKSEVLFGANAGKVWNALKSGGIMSAESLSKTTKLKLLDVFGALGWLGREGKIEIVSENSGMKFKLI